MGDFLTTDFVSHLIIFLVNLMLAISVHEAAHAWTSLKWGDDTAYLLGRVTLNPVSHTDPIGTLLIPIAAFIFGALGGALGNIPLIGWGKPTPVNPKKWTDYKKGNFWVSIAGVLANLILVVIGIALTKILFLSGYTLRELADGANPLLIFVKGLMTLNLSLAVFNLLPIPPLDGGKILGNFVPDSVKPVLDMIEQFGFMLLLLFVYLGIFRMIISPFFMLLGKILQSI
ncbi:MAG: site-2 protease family protein [Pyrinomonadaceae bacterium]|nr:site-2 protease family protein [Pyrinomonadaceae bacterium]